MSAERTVLHCVTREILADLETPLTVYLKLADQANTYLFESVQGGEQWGRYSIIGLPCDEVIRVYGNEVEHKGERFSVDDPLAWVAQYHETFDLRDAPEIFRLAGGFVGYFGYDVVRYVEQRLATGAGTDELGTPDILLMRSDELVVFDNLKGTLTLVVNHHDKTDAEKRLDALERQLFNSTAQAQVLPARGVTLTEKHYRHSLDQMAYKSAVQRCRDYIIAGDCMQVVPSQRMSGEYRGSAVNLYRALRTTNPSPYMYLLNLGDHHVVGSSPEILARAENGEVTIRPIAGTRKRGENLEQDLALEQDLLADGKELAEHLMLIDLARNDVGRIAEIGTVRVTEKMTVERYSHVMHIVSNVVGKLREGIKSIDVLRAAHPAGTLSGSPKVRAMEIIDELEPVKRCIYGGAVGYWSYSGNFDTAIAIRTAVIKDGQVHIQAGAGVVYDSDPESEWQETLNKARAVTRAVEMAEAVESKS
ncbi:MAG: anthranilate synthase component I [Gammaproteobacteria bacterium]|nr:anthranilate synthase component I [Gammaproteobacteria bacterium]